MKLCVDCASFGQSQTVQSDYGEGLINKLVCKDPRNSFPDPVFGAAIAYDCSWLRNLDEPHRCGPEGRWWQPKK